MLHMRSSEVRVLPNHPIRVRPGCGTFYLYSCSHVTCMYIAYQVHLYTAYQVHGDVTRHAPLHISKPRVTCIS